MSKALSQLKYNAIKLRESGYSYSIIKSKLGVPKSTLSGWLKDIPYKANSIVFKRTVKARLMAIKTLNRQRLARLDQIKKSAKSDINLITKRDLMFLGIGLYIGEGGKYDRGFIQFSNSDPKVIRLAIAWFANILKIDKKNFYLRLHIYPDIEEYEAVNYWSKITGTAPNQFGKIYIDKRLKAKTKRKLHYGTLHIRIRGLEEKYAKTNLYNKVLHWIKIVENYNFAGIV